MPDLPIPPEFRAEVLTPATALLRAGESCALVGVGSSGKSNIARHLARADVRPLYFGEAAPRTLILYLNCKPFAGRATTDFYLHALDKLEPAVSEAGRDLAGLGPEVSQLWQAAQANPEVLARRNLDKAIGRAVQIAAQHVIVILDDCDDLFAQAPPVFFSELRALRDNYKVHLAYLTLTRREPAFLRPEAKEYEELFELLSAPGHTLPVPPYTRADASTMIQRLAGRQTPPRQLPEAEVDRLYGWSGGHAGLIRSLYFTPGGDEALSDPAALDRLAANPDVADECGKIWDSLEREEQAALLAVAAGRAPEADDLRRLQRRGLVLPQGEIFSSVFARYLAQRIARPAAGRGEIEFPAGGKPVRVNGRPVAGLGPAEIEILRRLALARPEACSRVALLEAMRHGEQGGRPGEVTGDPLRRLEQYLQRLKARLGAVGQPLVTVGDGYRLE